jgi:hypothetical protein
LGYDLGTVLTVKATRKACKMASGC